MSSLRISRNHFWRPLHPREPLGWGGENAGYFSGYCTDLIICIYLHSSTDKYGVIRVGYWFYYVHGIIIEFCIEISCCHDNAIGGHDFVVTVI